VLGDGAPPLKDDAGENHHDGKLSEVDLLLLLIGKRYVFFFLLLGSDEETTVGLQR